MLRNKQAYSMTFWAVFIGLVLIPMLALTIEVSRFFSARAEVAEAADAAALAAAVEINQRVFEETGQLVPTSNTWSWAQQAVGLNTASLSQKGIHAFVSDIQVDDPANKVRVQVSANLSLLFPAVVPDISISQMGVAEVRAFSR